MSSDDLNINSVDRFRKSSTRLVLEQHGSCEVPAGCAGVVLRWHDPDEGQPALFECASSGRVEMFVNGQAVASRAVLKWGENILAVRISDADAAIPFSLSARRDIPSPESGELDEEFMILREGCTDNDGSWRVSREALNVEDWVDSEFDDSGWDPLLDTNAQVPDDNAWRFERLQRSGAVGLRLPGGASTLLVRTTMNVTRGVQ